MRVCAKPAHSEAEQRTAFLQNYFKDFFSSESAISFPLHDCITQEDSKIKEEREEEEVEAEASTHRFFGRQSKPSTNLKTGCPYCFRITFKLTD